MDGSRSTFQMSLGMIKKSFIHRALSQWATVSRDPLLHGSMFYFWKCAHMKSTAAFWWCMFALFKNRHIIACDEHCDEEWWENNMHASQPHFHNLGETNDQLVFMCAHLSKRALCYSSLMLCESLVDFTGDINQQYWYTIILGYMFLEYFDLLW